MEVSVGGGGLEWTLELASTPITSAFNGVASLLPDRAWHSPAILGAMSRAAGLALLAGRVRLAGLAPNGQRFVANPLHIWVARESSARLQGTDLGVMGPAPKQGQLRDFAIPQRGVFVVGRAFFA